MAVVVVGERGATGSARTGTVSYEYDLVGNRTRTTSANQVVSYGFDALNRLRTVRSGTPANPPTASTPAHEYEYAANGLRTAEVRPNGTRTEYAYNVRNHVTSVLHKAAAGALLLGLSYGVDATGLRNSITETVDGGALSRVTAYEYDANKRLIREEITRAGQTGTQVTSWAYDDVGNRVSQTVDGATLSYTYDANDRLLTESDGTSHVYDNNGNLVRTEKGSATQRYSWDSSGRLSEHTDASGIRTAYSYDPDRIRVSRTTRLGEADAQRTAYLIDYLQPYAQVLEEAAGPATSSVLTHQVAYVHGDDLIAQVRGGVAQHYHYDALGSTRLLSSSDGAVSDRYAYTAYGELDAAGSSVVSENAYRYTGEQFDSGLGMYYLRARYMDPGRGRFVGMDPFAGYVTDPMSRHRYQYGHANPVMFVDPSGLFSGTLGGASATTTIHATLSSVKTKFLMGTIIFSMIALASGDSPVAQVAPDFADPTQVSLIRSISQQGAASNVVTQRRHKGYPLVIFGKDVEDATAHYQDVINNNPAMATLNRKFPAHSRDWIRRNATNCTGLSGAGTGNDCDEYPFNSAVQGGYLNWKAGSVSLRPVRSDHNQSAGRDILQNKLYGPCGIKDKGAYGVIADKAIPSSFAICGNGRLIP